MVNVLSVPVLVLIKRLSMCLTFGCAAYVVYFLATVYNKPLFVESKSPFVSAPPSLMFDLKPYEPVAAIVQSRDIFVLPGVEVAPATEQTPVGKLPGHFKVVGIVIANSSQVIIEDLSKKKTYFISEGKPQAGINIMRVDKDRVIVNYQGQDILIPLK